MMRISSEVLLGEVSVAACPGSVLVSAAGTGSFASPLEDEKATECAPGLATSKLRREVVDGLEPDSGAVL